MTIWTIGHSTRPIEDFLAVLEAYEIEALIDVRRFPGSRRSPQFQPDALARALDTRSIAYRWLAALGGRRQPAPASRNVAWRHPAFRAYADHVGSEEFAAGLGELMMIAGGLRTVVMCAELLWWRCHRRLIADVLTACGEQVIHIRDVETSEVHRLALPARLVNGVLKY